MGKNPASNTVLLIIVAVFGIGLPGFIYSTSLTTLVRNDGVYVRFFPFHLKWVVFLFEDIDTYQTCTYNALKDYGGWGIRYGPKGKAYNVSGNRGLKLRLKDGRTVLIGSRSAEALEQACQQSVQVAIE